MPTVHVDLSALVANLALLRRRLQPGTELLAAVKADGYGHGAVPVARALEECGVPWFGVATPEEALELRAGGVRGRILLLGPAFTRVAELIDAGVTPTVSDQHSLDALRRAAPPPGTAVHLKVDTGMGRQGLAPAAARGLAAAIDAEPRLELEGVWTHFASADEPNRDFTERQIGAFEDLLGELRRSGLAPAFVHACNSAGLLAYPEAHYRMVRPGIALYGYPPSRHSGGLEPGLRPVATVSAPVTFVKRVSRGTPISYGGTWRAPRDTTIATVRFGYADGYPRLLANRAWATLAGTRAPVAGRICMDQLMLDVADLEVAPGDRAILLGPEGPTAGELGELAETVSYEILTSLGRRVERVYSPP